RLQVERDAALVAVGAHVHHALPVVPDIAAAPVALPGPLRRLDRDHVGADVRQRLDAHGAEQEMIEADDADSLQQIEHRTSPNPFRSFPPPLRGGELQRESRAACSRFIIWVPATGVPTTHSASQTRVNALLRSRGAPRGDERMLLRSGDTLYCVSLRSWKKCRLSAATAASIWDPGESVKSGSTLAIRSSLSPSRMQRSCSSPSCSVTMTVPLKAI